MLKFPENTKGMRRVDISYSTAPLSEYLGSHVYSVLGYDVHETMLGERAGKIVVIVTNYFLRKCFVFRGSKN